VSVREGLPIACSTYVCRPTQYAVVCGHIGRCHGTNVVDAIRVREGSKPEEAFQHISDACFQHVFLTCEQQKNLRGKHERAPNEGAEERRAQKQRME
jgi:hypothetical protein